ncbi:MAG: hypothetical protein JST42_16430 [Bacteroidetes bacterium]|nr:hypothetical protein [Bacteroidota bacterium]
MERLKELITRLKEQFDHQAEPAQLLEITRLLEAELQIMASQPAPAKVMPTKIAVMMPSAAKIVAGQQQPRKESAPAVSASVIGNGQTNSGVALEAGIEVEAAITAAPVAGVNGGVSGVAASGVNNGSVATATNGSIARKTIDAPPGKGPERGQWPFDPLAEKPTDRFTLSQKSREINDVIGSGNSSLNDRLRSDVADLKSTLNDSPVRDLKKAIGVNDRYVFINQLFRGDEVMYERSLKTINGFRILPEAEYWMERELKVKLGWDENRETTRHFYQLVKRRFS